jgi:hypothetical protein
MLLLLLPARELVRMHVRGCCCSAAGTYVANLSRAEKSPAEEDVRQALLVFVIPGWAWMWHEANDV